MTVKGSTSLAEQMGNGPAVLGDSLHSQTDGLWLSKYNKYSQITIAAGLCNETLTTAAHACCQLHIAPAAMMALAVERAMAQLT